MANLQLIILTSLSKTLSNTYIIHEILIILKPAIIFLIIAHNHSVLKQIFNIAAPGEHIAAQKILSMRIGVQHFSFAISNNNSDQLFQLVWYSADEIDENVLREIYARHPELRGSFYKILICYDHPGSIFVPDTFCNKNNSRMMLQTMYGSNGSDVILNETVTDWQLQNVYTIPSILKDWIRQHFPTAECWHDHTIGAKHINAGDAEGGLVIDFREHDLSVIVSKASKLLMVQTYSYSSPSDVIYYLLKICKEFSFLQEQVNLTISGLVEKESSLYRELYQYFLQLQFREPAWQIPVSQQEYYPSHFFTSLNDLALCAS